MVICLPCFDPCVLFCCLVFCFVSFSTERLRPNRSQVAEVNDTEVNDTEVCNYADDTTIFACDPDVNNVQYNKLEADACLLSKWFVDNHEAK